MKKFIIYTLPYSEDIGGVIALHKLCDLLNKSGYEAYLYPSIFPEGGYDLYSYNISSVPLMNQVLNRVFSLKQTLSLGTKISPDQIPEVFWVNQFFNTPVYKPDPNISFGEEWVVIYPEVTFGNPLRAKNVVRWMLSELGQNVPKEWLNTWSKNELVYYFNSELKFDQNPSKIGSIYKLLSCIYINPYAVKRNYEKRSGVCYTIRKAVNIHKKKVLLNESYTIYLLLILDQPL